MSQCDGTCGKRLPRGSSIVFWSRRSSGTQCDCGATVKFGLIFRQILYFPTNFRLELTRPHTKCPMCGTTPKRLPRPWGIFFRRSRHSGALCWSKILKTARLIFRLFDEFPTISDFWSGAATQCALCVRRSKNDSLGSAYYFKKIFISLPHSDAL
jgi:hypothetical protein